MCLNTLAFLSLRGAVELAAMAMATGFEVFLTSEQVRKALLFTLVVIAFIWSIVRQTNRQRDKATYR